MGELVYAATFMLPGLFGGEEGITANRDPGPHSSASTSRSQLQVYYVIAVWALVAAVLMHAFTRTPVGRMCNAVRDNPERAEFVGYNTQHVRFIAFAVAGLFAGLAGGLHAINYEIVAADAVSALRSGTVLLMAYIGGVRHFVGAVLGADHAHVAADQPERLHGGLAALSRPVLHGDHPVRAVGGLAGLIVMHAPIVRTRRSAGLLASYAVALVPALVMAAGAVAADRDELSPVDAAGSSGPGCGCFGIATRCGHAMALDWRRRAARSPASLFFARTWRAVAAAWERASDEARASRAADGAAGRR